MKTSTELDFSQLLLWMTINRINDELPTANGELLVSHHVPVYVDFSIENH